MFKKFNEENVNLYEFVSNKTYNKNQSSITRYAFISGSSDETLSKNYNFARINLYLSGSDYSQTNKKYNSYIKVLKHLILMLPSITTFETGNKSCHSFISTSSL